MLDEMTRFKICHILYIWKSKVVFSIFHFMLIYFFPNECPDLCRHRPGHSLGEKNKVARNEKWKKQLWGFLYIKYSKFWSVLLEHFVEHKPLISEEWWCTTTLQFRSRDLPMDMGNTRQQSPRRPRWLLWIQNKERNLPKTKTHSRRNWGWCNFTSTCGNWNWNWWQFRYFFDKFPKF